MKNFVLYRIKEYNIAVLTGNLTVDLEEHYKDKLLSVASNSPDTCYIECFQGKSKFKRELQFNILSSQECKVE